MTMRYSEVACPRCGQLTDSPGPCTTCMTKRTTAGIIIDACVVNHFPVDGNVITCGNRLDLPRKQRRHVPVDMGDDFKNKGTEGIVQVPVTACARCGRDTR